MSFEHLIEMSGREQRSAQVDLDRLRSVPAELQDEAWQDECAAAELRLHVAKAHEAEARSASRWRRLAPAADG